MQRHHRKPRKVIVAASIFPHGNQWEGLAARLETLCGMIDAKNRIARETYGRTTDLVVFTEHAVTGGAGKTAAAKSRPLDGAVLDAFAAKARQYETNVAVPLHLEEDRKNQVFYNAVVFLDRRGEVAGIYRKIHPVNGFANGAPEVLEGGISVGREANVIDLDFGRVGAQICYDMLYDDGWELLAEKGAELVVWASVSPRVFGAGLRAAQHGYWVVTATVRDNASILEPVTGNVAAQVRPPGNLVVHELDLSWYYSHWTPAMHRGSALTQAFGDRVGVHYVDEEDCGLFWSNDPERSIGEMLEAVGVDPDYDQVEHCRRLQEAARGGKPS